MKPRKRGRPRNPTEAPFFTQAIVRKALLEGKTDQVYNAILVLWYITWTLTIILSIIDFIFA
jgi:hypothetical protein